ncbi:MAG: DNA polymerase III subunit delta' [Pirellulales bacterium]|nr:DNA polymerase III subunit delta' [Pirellulales bacterium]
MTWLGIEGHDPVVERFRGMIASGRLASTYLFVGPQGIGKKLFALKLAKSLLCQVASAADLSPCDACDSCAQVEAGTHPDLNVIRKPDDKSEIPVAAFIGDKQHRMREGLCRWIAMSPMAGKRKIAIIDDADHLNEEGANALLKTLEEPPPDSLLILIGTSADRQLPTIRSRAQVIRFQPLDDSTIARLLTAQSIVSNDADAAAIAGIAHGSLAQAVDLADDDLLEFRTRFTQALAAESLESVRVAAMVSAFVDEAGRDAPRKRARLRQAVEFAVDYFRQQMRAGVEEPVASSNWASHPEIAADLIDRSLAAYHHIDRNAHLTTIVESWMDDLWRIANRARVVV